MKIFKKVTSEMALIDLKCIYLRVPCGWPLIAPPDGLADRGASSRQLAPSLKTFYKLEKKKIKKRGQKNPELFFFFKDGEI